MRSNRSIARRMLRTVALAALTLFAGFLIGVGAVRLAHDVNLNLPIFGATSTDTSTQSQDANESLAYQESLSYTTWDPLQSPNYYRMDGPAVVAYDLEPGTARYAPLDALGRARGAATLATYDSMMAGRDRPRESLSDVSPSGWGHNQEVDIAMPDGSIYHGQLFNRSHLVAKSLGGDDEAHNLICATRTQNVGANIQGTDGGMAYGEDLARTWLENHREGMLYYAATPVYEGDELVARSVFVDIKSSDGSIDQHIEVYNAALGFSLDYATGAFSVTEVASDAAAKMHNNETEVEEPTEAEDLDRMVVVTGSGAAYHHDESCSGLAQARSMRWVTVAEAQAMGRHPCGICGG